MSTTGLHLTQSQALCSSLHHHLSTMSSDPLVDYYKATMYENLFLGLVYSVYLVLYVTSVHILLCSPGFTSSRPRMFMFGITTFMFIMGIIALVLEKTLEFQSIQWVTLIFSTTAGDVWSSYHTNVVFAVDATIIRLMYILGDIICAWRAVVLWNRHSHVIAILLLFILGTTAAAGCELGLSLVPLFKSDLPYFTTQGKATVNFGPLIMVGPTLATNLVSTGLIAWKAWQRRISIRRHLGEGSGSVRAERVFALLIESGFIYCCLWILYLISAFGVILPPAFVIMNHVLVFASGLYPTLIIIFVAMQKSPIEYYSTGMQFARGPAGGPPTVGDNVYPIRHEYASDSDTHVPSMVFVVTSDEEKGGSLLQAQSAGL
ncbi:hypothetical protein EDB92DRAFT_1390488 [Lactarius akahatsu]|uniref:Uncharacterized protein n=1 Tax=Lactarius akahatsu TaxID=416441 RepID=A0AAD4LB39_9AGAM|nr:hypothetical protein EDB92DRAFT_1390488 [Lactarius akahatsu]